ncbi:MAG: NmrA family NAD(P)-binding protein [Rhodobacteraceae bacterium]|nr:NmrA family NAD(P)-binding protein [Paracoccaceae bacterium]
MTATALILGANGRFGHNVASAFASAGWNVRRFDRSNDTLDRASEGADIIVNGWNPAYPDWATTVPALTRQIIAAARQSGATVLVPGNVYVYGEGSPTLLAPGTPHSATNPLGRVRIEMEAACRASDVQTILLRAGDFIDNEASGNWFDRVMTTKLDKGKLVYPGRCDVAHAWAYLPDLAAACVALAEQRETLARFEEVPFPGYTMTGNELAAALTKVTGRSVEAAPMPWLPIRLARPIWPMARHLLEMRYLWTMPHRLDGTRFGQLLPDATQTPLRQALAAALELDIHPHQAVA